MAAFVRDLEDGLVVTAELGEPVSFPDTPPVLLSDVRLGVTYAPLRGWWPLLGERFAGALTETDAIDLDESVGAGDVPAAVERLATTIERAEPPPVSLDSLVRQTDGLDQAALLAAAGRFDEASAALAGLETEPCAREARRTAHQVRRLIDARGDRALLPSEPVPREWHRERPSLRAGLAEGRAQQAAVRAVRDAGPADRDELRSRLEQELARREASMSPFEVEQTLDRLGDTPADRRHARAEAAKTLGRLGLGLARAIRDRRLPDLSTPEWLEPPDPAFYALPQTDRWNRVRLDEGSEDQLTRMHEAVRMRVAQSALLTAWLRPGEDGLAVCVGRDRVGIVPADTYATVVEAARFREEHVVVPARLTRREQAPRYLLEVASPPAQGVPRNAPEA